MAKEFTPGRRFYLIKSGTGQTKAVQPPRKLTVFLQGILFTPDIKFYFLFSCNFFIIKRRAVLFLLYAKFKMLRNEIHRQPFYCFVLIYVLKLDL